MVDRGVWAGVPGMRRVRVARATVLARGAPEVPHVLGVQQARGGEATRQPRQGHYAGAQ